MAGGNGIAKGIQTGVACIKPEPCVGRRAAERVDFKVNVDWRRPDQRPRYATMPHVDRGTINV